MSHGQASSRGRGRRGAALATALLIAAAGTASASGSDAGDVSAAERLVRRTYYEGLPYDEVRTTGPAGAARWIGMLADPSERVHAATVAEALGIAAPPGAYQALAAAGDEAARAVGADASDHAARRLQRAVPLAMGHLARSDPRALQWLIAAAGPGAGGTRREVERRLRAIAGLGLSGRAGAAAALRAWAREGPGEVALHARDALVLNEEIATRGADAVLGARRGTRR